VKNILILSTGGTFNKHYDPIAGELRIDPDASALHSLATQWQTQFEVQTLIGKDSLEMDDTDRHTLLEAIRRANASAILVVHGTDTMNRSAAVIAAADLDKTVIFTGSMVPFSIDPVEATANLASAIGWVQGGLPSGVYIAMNGVFGRFDEVVKDRQAGKFIPRGG
jgi:L-asparaginase